MNTFTLLELDSIIKDNPVFFFAYFLFLGAAVGSFCHFLAFRSAKHQPVSESQSRCDHCGELLKRRYNIPILGFLLLRGQTACCHKALSIQHFLYEFLFGMTTSLFFLYQTLSIESLTSLLFWYLVSTVFITSNYKNHFTSEDKWLLLTSSMAIVVLLFSGEDNNTLKISTFFIYLFAANIFLLFIKHWAGKSLRVNFKHPLLWLIFFFFWGEWCIVFMLISFLMPLVLARDMRAQNLFYWTAITVFLLR